MASGGPEGTVERTEEGGEGQEEVYMGRMLQES